MRRRDGRRPPRRARFATSAHHPNRNPRTRETALLRVRGDPRYPRENEVFARLNSATAGERRRVPAAEAGDLDDVSGMRRVDELAAADVDPDVARAGEEDEVAGLE